MFNIYKIFLILTTYICWHWLSFHSNFFPAWFKLNSQIVSETLKLVLSDIFSIFFSRNQLYICRYSCSQFLEEFAPMQHNNINWSFFKCFVKQLCSLKHAVYFHFICFNELNTHHWFCHVLILCGLTCHRLKRVISVLWNKNTILGPPTVDLFL